MIFTGSGFGVLQSLEAAETSSSYASYHEIEIGDYLSDDKDFVYDIYIGWKHSSTESGGTNNYYRQPTIQFGRGSSSSFTAVPMKTMTRAIGGGGSSISRSSRDDEDSAIWLVGSNVPSFILNTGAVTYLRVRNSYTVGSGVEGWTVGTYDGSQSFFSKIIGRNYGGYANDVPDIIRIRPQTANSSLQGVVFFTELAVTIHRVQDVLLNE
jgi:hypothetical protein